LSRYNVEREIRDGVAVIVLKDLETNSQAEVVPDIGNNLIRFESNGRQLLEAPASLSDMRNENFGATMHGMPMLFPPNRVKGGKFSFNDRLYSLPLNEPPDHHLHGEICFRKWEIIDFGASEDSGAYVTSCFSYESWPEIMTYFPHPLVFTITHRLQEGRLDLDGTITNEGAEEAPFAFGLHPYFPIPASGGDAVVLQIPAAAEWPVSDLSFVLDKPAVTDFSLILNKGAPIGDFPALGCSLLSMREVDSTCRILIRDGGYSIVFRFDRLFPYLLLFRPDWSSSFSLEPYTSVTDAFNLPYEKELTGARGIAGGETVAFKTSIWIEPREQDE